MPASPITLHVTRAGFELPDNSLFVMKTGVQLKMAGLAYHRITTIPPLAPNETLPYIVDRGEVVTDSRLIHTHIERAYVADPDRDWMRASGPSTGRSSVCWKATSTSP